MIKEGEFGEQNIVANDFKGFKKISVDCVYLVSWIKTFNNEFGKDQQIWSSRSMFHNTMLFFHNELTEVRSQPVVEVEHFLTKGEKRDRTEVDS